MRLVLVSLCALLCVPVARAQQEEDRDDPPLPDIAPREVEIRGKLDISFPALRRPALSGLLPPVRVEPIPPLPPPTLQDVEPPVATPQALAEGETTRSGFAPLPPPQRALIEAGGGRYFSRFGRARFERPLGAQWAFRTRLDYGGTDGFAPFDAENVQTPADELRGSATVRTERDAFTAALTADGFFGQHQLYGAERAATGVTAGVAEHPARDQYGGRLALHLQTDGRVPLEARARFEQTQVRTDLLGGSDGTGPGGNDPNGNDPNGNDPNGNDPNGNDPNERFERGERRFGGSLRARASFAGTRAAADVRGSTAQLSSGLGEDAGGFDGTSSFLDAGAGVWLLRGTPFRLFAGARVLTFSSEGDAGTYPAPDVRLEWRAANRLTLYARTQPGAKANRLAQRYRENPSLLYEDAQQPTVRTLDAEGGLRYFPTAALQVHTFAGYRRAPSRLFYEDAQADATDPLFYERGVTTARYAEARILRAGGTLSFRRDERLHASLSVAYRDGRLAQEDAPLPYFAPLTAQALLAYGFAEGDGRVQFTGSFESARPTTRASGTEVDAFVDLDVEGSYALTPAISVVVRLQNLSPGTLERYDRYPLPPLIFESGLRVRF